MYQGYPNFYQPQQPSKVSSNSMPMSLPQQMQPQFLKGRLVSSIDEVKATPIDFDGSIFFFPDLANKRIYTKQINLDGTAATCMYELKNMPIETNNAPGNNDVFITRDEFENTITKIQNILNKMSQPQEQVNTQVVQQNAPSTNEPVFKF